MTNKRIDPNSFISRGIIRKTDGYKFSHHRQYPPGMDKLYSYLEARTGGEYPATTFFGLQYILKRHLVGQVVTKEEIDLGQRRVEAMFGRKDVFNRKDWERILYEHGGRLPLVIKAVPEGTTVPESNVLMTVENLDPEGLVPQLPTKKSRVNLLI
jgi:nicotinamide phosphoribosyltransferase